MNRKVKIVGNGLCSPNLTDVSALEAVQLLKIAQKILYRQIYGKLKTLDSGQGSWFCQHLSSA